MVWHRLDMMPNPKARDMLEGVLAHFAKGVNGDFAALTAPQSAIAPPRQS
jgi:hypothetical protein